MPIAKFNCKTLEGHSCTHLCSERGQGIPPQNPTDPRNWEARGRLRPTFYHVQMSMFNDYYFVCGLVPCTDREISPFAQANASLPQPASSGNSLLNYCFITPSALLKKQDLFFLEMAKFLCELEHCLKFIPILTLLCFVPQETIWNKFPTVFKESKSDQFQRNWERS